MDWTGGPVTPSPVPITFNPLAQPVSDTVPTGIVLDGRELILYFWGSGSYGPGLDTAWLDRSTGRAGAEGPWRSEAYLSGTNGFGFLVQMQLSDLTLVEFGSFRGLVSRMDCTDRGKLVEARFTPWSRDRTVTIFWLHRRGDPVPRNIPSGPGLWVPLAPEKYPLITAHGADGQPIGSSRLRPPGGEQKGG